MSRTNSPTQHAQPSTPPTPTTPALAAGRNARPQPPNPNDPAFRFDRSGGRRSESSTLASLWRWAQVKKYQYEVTFSLYMLTGTEKAIFNLILVVLVTLLVVAASMYLPDHLMIIYRRIWYYVHGQGEGVAVPTLARGLVETRVGLAKDGFGATGRARVKGEL